MPHALLLLADGTLFHGLSVGAKGECVGEVVFNTAMTGYQEILTDPSYTKQIVTLTYPHIGNYGTNMADGEAEHTYASGLIVRDCALHTSNFRSTQSLRDYLREQNVVAISGVDTRYLTAHLREYGVQSGAIVTGETDVLNLQKRAQQLIEQFSGLVNVDLAQLVSCKAPYEFREQDICQPISADDDNKESLRVLVLDYGVKRSILRTLLLSGCRVFVVPATMPFEEIMTYKPDGILLSNGPGDPSPCDYAISTIRTLLEKNIPLFGICLGHQLLALACGAKTTKMKFGHHGANHPVQDVETRRVYITSQNHNFMVDMNSLPAHLRVTHVSLFDNSLQGFAHRQKPAFSFQGHPEAGPGPVEMSYLFEHFIKLMMEYHA